MGAVCVNNVWRMYKKELNQLYRELDVTGNIQLGLLKWNGQIDRILKFKQILKIYLIRLMFPSFENDGNINLIR